MHPTTRWILAALLALATPATTPAQDPARAARGDWSFDLLDEAGKTLPTFLHGGRTYVLGTAGRRYQVRVRNESGRRAEVVVSVDGRDVIDGGPSATEKRGYLVDAHGEVRIDGFRTSESAVAAFRFGTVARSYAALEGDARDVGVIGVAVFPERRPPPASRRAAPAPAQEKSASAGVASSESLDAAPTERRPGLGTAFGEERGSPVQEVAFLRESSRPSAVLTLRYDDRPGLLAAGVNVDGRSCGTDDALLRRTADPFRRDTRFAPPPRGG
jgi:hypothetical protein